MIRYRLAALSGAAVLGLASVGAVLASGSPAEATTYTVVTSSVSLSVSTASPTQAFAHADCPAGAVVTGGGIDVVNLSGDSGFQTSEAVQVDRADQVSGSWTRWEVGIVYQTSGGSFTGTLTAQAVCAS